MFAMKLELLAEDLNDYPTLGNLKDIYHVSVPEKHDFLKSSLPF